MSAAYLRTPALEVIHGARLEFKRETDIDPVDGELYEASPDGFQVMVSDREVAVFHPIIVVLIPRTFRGEPVEPERDSAGEPVTRGCSHASRLDYRFGSP